MTLDRMTRDDTMQFAINAKRSFRGDWDDELWKLALPRIAAESREIAYRALAEYTLQWGGPRARFIPSKFFQILAQVKDQIEGARAAEKRIADSTARMMSLDENAKAVEADWLERRREIEIANPLHVGEAIDYLRSLGWGNPPQDFNDWSRAWILAVSDLVTDRECPALDPATGSFVSNAAGDGGSFRAGRILNPVTAREFYRRAGKAAPFALGATER
jgi:hypothetical protein